MLSVQQCSDYIGGPLKRFVCNRFGANCCLKLNVYKTRTQFSKTKTFPKPKVVFQYYFPYKNQNEVSKGFVNRFGEHSFLHTQTVTKLESNILKRKPCRNPNQLFNTISYAKIKIKSPKDSFVTILEHAVFLAYPNLQRT